MWSSPGLKPKQRHTLVPAVVRAAKGGCKQQPVRERGGSAGDEVSAHADGRRWRRVARQLCDGAARSGEREWQLQLQPSSLRRRRRSVHSEDRAAASCWQRCARLRSTESLPTGSAETTTSTECLAWLRSRTTAPHIRMRSSREPRERGQHDEAGRRQEDHADRASCARGGHMTEIAETSPLTGPTYLR